MIKTKINNCTLLVFIVALFFTSLASLPARASAITFLAPNDPNPCFNVGDAVIGAVTSFVPSIPGAGSVPVDDEEANKKLEKIKKEACENTAIKRKTVGKSFRGIPIPYSSWDALVKKVIKEIIKKLTDDTVRWINSGFDGNPNFITNPEEFFKNIGDNLAGEFIQGSELSGLCSPFQAKIRLALNKQYFQSRSSDSYEDRSQCTLSQIGVNLESFYGDFSEGGWEGWFEMTQNDSNNPYGAYLSAQVELDSRIAKKLKLEELQSNWNKGFISNKDCLRRAPVSAEQKKATPDAKGACLEYGPIKTPGSIIEGQLQGVLGQGVVDLGLARSFDDLISALVTALGQKIFNNDRGNGLFPTNPRSRGENFTGEGTTGGTELKVEDGRSTPPTGTTIPQGPVGNLPPDGDENTTPSSSTNPGGRIIDIGSEPTI